MKSVIKNIFFGLKEFFRYREAFAFFLVLTDKNEIFDYSCVTGGERSEE